jgi:methionyl-tRNA formyltransferase
MIQNIKQKICLAGKNEIAVYGLSLLLELVDKENLCVLSNATDDGFDTWQPSLLKAAIENGIAVKTLDECYRIDGLIFISLEFDKIVSPNKFVNANLYNIHFSNLPSYKGMYTSALPLLNGEKSSGVTLHYIDAGIDTGDIIDQIQFPINDSDTARNLYEKYLVHSKNLLRKNIAKLLSGEVCYHPQSANGSTYYSKKAIDYKCLEIDLRQTAEQIKNQIRAFTFPEYQVPKVLDCYVNAADISSKKSTEKPGTLIQSRLDTISIATVDYDLTLYLDMNYELLNAAATDAVSKALACITNGANIEYRNGKGWTPLIIASFNGSINVLKLLLSEGVDVNQTNYKGTTPLMYAMTHYENTGERCVFDLLIKHGANLDLRDFSGLSLKDYAKNRAVRGLFE